MATIAEQTLDLLPSDLEMVRQAGDSLFQLMEEFVDIFYRALAESDLEPVLEDHVEEITDLFREGLQEFFQGQDPAASRQLIEELVHLLLDMGVTYDGLNRAYFAVFSSMVANTDITRPVLAVLVKAMYFWSDVTVQVFNDFLEEAQELVAEISSPAQLLWDNILSVPITGRMDSHRFATITENVLETVHRYEADIIIFDIGGLEDIDSDVASHFVRLIQAVNLMGTEVVAVGIGPNTSRAFVRLDVDLSSLRLKTFATFKQGLTYAFETTGAARTFAQGSN